MSSPAGPEHCTDEICSSWEVKERHWEKRKWACEDYQYSTVKMTWTATRGVCKSLETLVIHSSSNNSQLYLHYMMWGDLSAGPSAPWGYASMPWQTPVFSYTLQRWVSQWTHSKKTVVNHIYLYIWKQGCQWGTTDLKFCCVAENSAGQHKKQEANIKPMIKSDDTRCHSPDIKHLWTHMADSKFSFQSRTSINYCRQTNFPLSSIYLDGCAASA